MSMCKTLAATILAGTMLFAGSAAAADKAPSGTASSKDGKAMELVQEWDKVFPRSDKVEHRKVTFRTRYGTVLAGDLYVPRDARGKLAALAVSGPFGAVKEQASGLYAQTMAERGFLTLAFDPSYTGEIRSAVLLVHGEKAHSRYFSEDAFKKLSGNNKELMIVPRASHTDLYDRVDIIPFDRIEAFFKANL